MRPDIVLTALYVPGDRPDRFAKAAASGADVVLLDLEDAVSPSAKARARQAVVTWLSGIDGGPGDVRVQVRVNALDSSWGADDLAALRALTPMPALRLPKVASVGQVDDYVALAGGTAVIHALIESAAGVEAAAEIARHRCVESLGLGEADLAADLHTSGEAALAWVRSRIVVAARAAGLPSPMQSVFADVRDLDGLAESCLAGAALGLVGRAAIHPRQLPVIAAAYRPGAAEVARAHQVLAAWRTAEAAGQGVVALESGVMVDAAMVPRAEQVLALDRAAARVLELHADRR